MRRRNFLKILPAGFLLSRNNIFADYSVKVNKNDNNVIFIHLSGGPTHIETFNPIPNAPVERRSCVGHCDTNVAGIQIGGLFTNLANKMDKCAVVRGFHHKDANHLTASYWINTGESNFGSNTQKNASHGSIICGHYGTNIEPIGVPSYVKLNEIDGDDGAWMGAKYNGYDANKEGVGDLSLKISHERFNRRLDIINKVEGASFLSEQHLGSEWIDLREQAVNVLMGGVSECFEVEKDSAFDRFKSDKFGKDCLTAVRLVQQGCKMVTINYGGWDMHNTIEASLKARVPSLDLHFSSLLDLLKERDLSSRTLVVLTGEFGRTPKINGNAGRDHWANSTSLLLACDAYEMGRLIGETNAEAEFPQEGACTPEDLRCTIADHMGIDRTSTWTSIEKRPMPVVKQGSKNILMEV